MPELITIPLNEIDADSTFNCREKITPIETLELARNIKDLGLLQPVIVRRLNIPQGEKQWQLIAGYRRYTSFKMLSEEDPEKFGKIPATPLICTDLEAFRINVVENVQRKDLNIKEEAHAVQRLLDEGMSRDQVCKEVGKSMGWLQGRLMMIDLPLDIQDTVVQYNFTQSMIRELWQMPSDEMRYEKVRRVIDMKERGDKVTVIEKRVRPLDKKLTPKKDEIFEMMEKVSKIYGKYNTVTRSMAWCAGEITDRVFLEDVAKDAQVTK